jgi:hypothetical protein
MTVAQSVATSNRLLAVGLSHKTAAIEHRERTALNDRLARSPASARPGACG